MTKEGDREEIGGVIRENIHGEVTFSQLTSTHPLSLISQDVRGEEGEREGGRKRGKETSERESQKQADEKYSML